MKIDRKVYWVAEPLLNLGDWGLVSMMFASRLFVKLATTERHFHESIKINTFLNGVWKKKK